MVYAQQDYFKHEVSLSYGFRPILSIPAPALPISDGAYGQMYRFDSKRNIGTFNLTYLYHLSKSIAIGGIYAYGNEKYTLRNGFEPINLATYNGNYHLIMPTAKYEWLHTGSFCFYSRVAIGICYTPKVDVDVLWPWGLSESGDYFTEQHSHITFAWQVVPLGIELRFIKHFAFFVEGGAGSSGYGLAGVKAFF
jgi:hypothetical protein